MAVGTKNPEFDGVFYFAVRTTGFFLAAVVEINESGLKESVEVIL